MTEANTHAPTSIHKDTQLGAEWRSKEMTIQSDAEIFGEVGGENYFLPLCERRNEVLTEVCSQSGWTPEQYEYAACFLSRPPAGILMSQYETFEFLWLGNRADEPRAVA